MASSIDEAFGESTPIILSKCPRYAQAVGFNYNWTQDLNTSGQQLAALLDTLKSAGIRTVDIEAHSEGVPVALSAASQTQIRVGNVIALGGPIMGTPAADN